RINRVLHHEIAVGYRNGQRAAAAAFPGDGSNDWNLHARHLAQIPCNGFRLAALFRTQPGISARSIDKSKDRAAEFFRHLHTTQCLAIALWIGLPEVTIDALFCVAPLLVA